MPESKVCGPETTRTLWGPLCQCQVTESPGATVTSVGPKDLPTMFTVAAAEAAAGSTAARESAISRARMRRGMTGNLGRLGWQPPWGIRPRTPRAGTRALGGVASIAQDARSLTDVRRSRPRVPHGARADGPRRPPAGPVAGVDDHAPGADPRRAGRPLGDVPAVGGGGRQAGGLPGAAHRRQGTWGRALAAAAQCPPRRLAFRLALHRALAQGGAPLARAGLDPRQPRHGAARRAQLDRGPARPLPLDGRARRQLVRAPARRQARVL